MFRKTLLTLLLTACASTGAYPRTYAWVRVKNSHWLEHVVYAQCGGANVRIGEARGLGNTTLRLPSWCVNLGRGVAFVVDPIGSPERSASDYIGVRPGETLILEIPPRTNGDLFVRR